MPGKERDWGCTPCKVCTPRRGAKSQGWAGDFFFSFPQSILFLFLSHFFFLARKEKKNPEAPLYPFLKKSVQSVQALQYPGYHPRSYRPAKVAPPPSPQGAAPPLRPRPSPPLYPRPLCEPTSPSAQRGGRPPVMHPSSKCPARPATRERARRGPLHFQTSRAMLACAAQALARRARATTATAASAASALGLASA